MKTTVTILLGLFVIIIIVNVFNNRKLVVSNTLILFWDIHCKINIVNFLNKNNIEYRIVDIKNDIGVIIKVCNNHYCLMEKHPQEYDNIHILLDGITEIIQELNATSLIGISTAGSKIFRIGSVLQFDSAIIQNFNEYSLNKNFVKCDKTLIKTKNYIDYPIDDTKGFIPPFKNQVAAGEDEFVVFIISNHLKIPSLTLTGISDNYSAKQYDDGGGKISAENTIDFLFNNINLLS